MVTQRPVMLPARGTDVEVLVVIVPPVISTRFGSGSTSPFVLISVGIAMLLFLRMLFSAVFLLCEGGVESTQSPVDQKPAQEARLSRGGQSSFEARLPDRGHRGRRPELCGAPPERRAERAQRRRGELRFDEIG